MFTTARPRARIGLGLGTGVGIAALSLILAPLTATADEAAAPDVAPITAAAEPAADSTAADPAAATDAAADPVADAASEAAADPAVDAATEPIAPPAEVVVAEPGTTAEETLAEPTDTPTVTLFADTADAAIEPFAAPLAAEPAPGDPCYPAVCISNGTILLAVNPTGELNTGDGTGSAAGPGSVGLEYLPTGNDGTSPGCLCEGWGVADPATGVWGSADRDQGMGGKNLELESFTWTGSTATSVVKVLDVEGSPVFRVTHQYVPSPATPNLYQVNVTIENLTGATIATVQYRRVMDWDIEPTAFNEYVTINGGTASALKYTNDNGFESPNPLVSPTKINFEGDAVDNGPDDHGALFDFSFGPLAPGAALNFVIFYGAAATEAEANAALAAVGAEAYSFGQTSTDPAGGTPNTFIFAFGNVGGAPIFGTPPAPAPASVPAPAAAAPVTPVAAVATTADSGPALASTGVEATPVVWGAIAALLAGLALVVTTLASRRRRVE